MALILIMGIPGAGKTTLAQEISKIVIKQSKKCHIFSFDDALESIDWSETARTSRKTWEDEVKDEIRKRLESNLEEGWIFVVDDIFYMASMRRPFERFARRIGLGFFVVFLKTELEEALKRNLRRDKKNQIPEEMIRNINIRLEIPSEAQIFQDPELTETEHFIQKVLATPRPPPMPETEIEERPESAPSKWSQLDSDLRKIVSKMMEKETNRRKAKLINDKRRKFFEQLKAENIKTWDFIELDRKFCDFCNF